MRALAADHLLAFWLKLVEVMPEARLLPVPEGCAVERLELEPPAIEGGHEGILRFYFDRLAQLEPEPFLILMRSYYQPKRIFAELLRLWEDPAAFQEMRRLLVRLLKDAYSFWLENDDPFLWLQKQTAETTSGSPWLSCCASLGLGEYHAHLRTILDLEQVVDDREAVKRLLQLPDYQEIVQPYSRLPQELKTFESDAGGDHPSMLMLLKIMETKGLEVIHEETLTRNQPGAHPADPSGTGRIPAEFSGPGISGVGRQPAHSIRKPPCNAFAPLVWKSWKRATNNSSIFSCGG